MWLYRYSTFAGLVSFPCCLALAVSSNIEEAWREYGSLRGRRDKLESRG